MVDRRHFGLGLMALAAMVFSAMSALAKFAIGRLPPAEVVFFRSLVAAVALLIIHRATAPGSGPLWGRQRGLLALRGLFGALALMLYFIALGGLPVANAMLLNNTSPLFVLFLAVPFLGERVGRGQWLLVPLALAGVALVLKPDLDLFRAAGLAGLGSAVLSGAAYICVRKLARSEPAHVVVLYFAVGSVLISAPFMLADFRVPDAACAWAMVGVGALSVAAQMLLTAAYRFDTAGRVAAAGLLGPVFAAGWDVLFWGRWPDLWTGVGGLLVLGALLELARQRPAATPARPA